MSDSTFGKLFSKILYYSNVFLWESIRIIWMKLYKHQNNSLLWLSVFIMILKWHRVCYKKS